MRTSWFSAVLLALSLCLKPTLAPLGLLYLVSSRRWRVLGPIFGVTIVSCIVFGLLERGTNWYASLLGNVDLLFSSGVAALGEQNLTRSDRIDFQLPLYGLTHNIHAAALGAGALTVVLLLLWVAASRRPHKVTLDHELLSVSTLLVIGLLPFYQRYYCAVLLLLPALWALRNLQSIHAKIVLTLCSLFLVNTSVLPRLVGLRSSYISFAGRLTEVLVLPHLCWAVLVISVVLLRAVYVHPCPQRNIIADCSV